MKELKFVPKDYRSNIEALYNPDGVGSDLAGIYQIHKEKIDRLYELDPESTLDFAALCAGPNVVPFGLSIAQATLVDHAIICGIDRKTAYSYLTQFFMCAGGASDNRFEMGDPHWTTFMDMIDSGTDPAYAAHLMHVIGGQAPDKREAIGPFKVDYQRDEAVKKYVALIHADMRDVVRYPDSDTSYFDALVRKILNEFPEVTHINTATAIPKEQLYTIFPRAFVDGLNEWSDQWSSTDMTTWEMFVREDGTLDTEMLVDFISGALGETEILGMLSHLPRRIHYGPVKFDKVVQSREQE